MQEIIDCSILIPIYNAEKTILGLLDCLHLKDRFKYNIEVILINDGSNDRSQEIIEKYIVDCHNVKLINIKNSGVSAARNIGLSYIRGRYVYFADADDLVNVSVLINMIDCADRLCLDIVFANYETKYLFSEAKTTYNCNIPCDGNSFGKDYIEYTLLRRFYNEDNTGLSSLWNKLYSTRLILDAKIKFDEKMSHGEDWAFNIEILQYAERIAAIGETVYTYRLNGSQTYDKYRTNLGYSLANGYDIICNLNKKYGFVPANSFEEKSVAIRFFEQIAHYLKMETVSKTEKRNLLILLP